MPIVIDIIEQLDVSFVDVEAGPFEDVDSRINPERLKIPAFLLVVWLLYLVVPPSMPVLCNGLLSIY